MSRAGVSPLTIHRLSLYLRGLRQLAAAGVETISAQVLARRYRLSATQIRKDLAQFGEFGIRGVGYDVERLGSRLERLLGVDRERKVAIVGAGNLGSALARFLGGEDDSFRVVALFDHDRTKVGRRLEGLTIRPASELAEGIRSSGAEIGVLAVPGEAAQSNYDALADAGIGAVLNFAPLQIVERPEVPVRTVDLRVQLEELAFLLG